MQALVLAAGVGRRMLPLTDAVPKTLLTVGGSMIIDRIIGGLERRGVTPITVVTGYRADELRAHLGSCFPHLDVRYVHNAEYDSTNNIHSMALAFEQMDLDDDLVLIESDLVYEDGVLDQLIGSPHPDVALVDRYRTGMDGTVVTLSETGVVTQVIPPHLQMRDFSFADKYKTLNIYRFSAEFCTGPLRELLGQYTRMWGRNAYYELVLGILVYLQQAEVFGEVVQDRWAEVDDPNDLRVAEYEFSPGKRYELLTSAWGGSWTTDVLDFAFIRNTYFPTPAMVSELRHNLPDLLAGYGSRQEVLDEKLAWALGYPVPLVHAVAGASQVYPWLRSWFAGRRVLVPAPTFGEYDRIFPDAARYRDQPGLRWEDVERLGADADVVVFVNPNNPTGTVLPTTTIADYARRHPSTTVVVDESFIDFSDEVSVVQQMSDGGLDNVLVIKSLSKSLGVPGLRVGALVTSDGALAGRIRDATPIWNLSSMAEHFLEIMLKHRVPLERSFHRTAADRDLLTQELKASPLVHTVLPSAGNFLLVRLTVDAAGADAGARWLVEHRAVLVKDVSTKMADGGGWWRIAVRDAHDIGVLVQAMRDLHAHGQVPRPASDASPAPLGST